MKTLTNYFLFIAFLFVAFTSEAQIYERTDTLFVPETENIPVIDGLYDDEAWGLTEWRNIDQVWMPYDNDPANLGHEAGLKIWEGPDDFSGKYKVVWSSETNLLYFVVEIVDDVFVDGYEYPNGGYHKYDILEIFIDEDRSGGPHIHDTNDSNAENAFAHHMAVNQMPDGELQTELLSLDMAGTGWGNNITRNYAGHFPDFGMRKVENTFVWEFSLRMHADDYNNSNPEASVVDLKPEKVFGLSLAYCDNDDLNENPIERDHFFGSVYVPVEAHNDHWQNADWFGVTKLTGEGEANSSDLLSVLKPEIKIYTAGKILYSSVVSPDNGQVDIKVFNISGQEVMRKSFQKESINWNKRIELDGLQNAIYIVEVSVGNAKQSEKIIVR
jgi:hypothetical protein